MAGFMDFFSQATGGQAGGLNDLLTEEQRRAINQQSMMAMAAQLLQAGGPSDKRTSLGQALGQGFTAAQTAQQTGQTNALNQMLTKQKIDEYKAEQEMRKRLGAIFSPTAEPSLTPAQAALAAPTSTAGPVGPTMQRAQIAAATPATNPRVEQASRYRQAAALYGSDPVKAKAYMDIAEQLDPRQEVTGQPLKLTDQSGQEVMVQQMKDGTLRTMAGFGPPREVVLQNLGGRTVAIDKSRLKGDESYAQTMTPGEVASNRVALGNLAVAQGGLNLRNQEFQRGAFDRVETPEGFFNVPKGGGVAVPVMGPAGQLRGTGGTPTEGQSNAAGFAQRMELSESILAKLPAGSQPGMGTRVAEAVPFIGGALARASQSPDTQMYDQAAQDWIRAKLRKESGAAIGADEMSQEYATYFPVVGDGPEKIAQKAEARRVATLAMGRSAGKAYQPYVPPAAPDKPAAATASKKMVWDGTKFVFQ